MTGIINELQVRISSWGFLSEVYCQASIPNSWVKKQGRNDESMKYKDRKYGNKK
jgi:hypothetical protein